jgi:hypothetical protein
MFAAALPIIGATLGGIEGYRRSGGDLGAAALSAGLGAAIPGGLRMAGTALGGTQIGANLLGLGSKGLSQGASVLGQGAKAVGLKGLAQGPIAPLTAAGLGAAAAGVGGLIAPSLAGQVGAGVKDVVRGPAQLGAGYVGSRGPGAPNYEQIGGNAVPVVDAYGNVSILGTDPLGNILPGMTRSAESLREATAQRDAMRLLYPEVAAASEARSKKEFERQMAAAGIRQNIETASNMLQRSQQSMQQMGQTAAQQMGNALIQQNQYA